MYSDFFAVLFSSLIQAMECLSSNSTSAFTSSNQSLCFVAEKPRNSDAAARVRKYRDIFENIKISKISKKCHDFLYISDNLDIFDIFKSELVTRVGLLNKLLNHAKIAKLLNV